MAFGWDDAAMAALLIGDYVYHRWIEDHRPPPPAREVSMPRTDEGAPYPLIFGRCRVKAPIPAWVSDPVAAFQDPVHGSGDISGDVYAGGISTYLYFMDMLMVLGIPFDGASTNKLYTMYAGEAILVNITPGNASLADLDGNGGFEDGYPGGSAGHRMCIVSSPSGFGDVSQGAIEYLNGKATQQLVDVATPYAATTQAGRYMSRDNIGTGGTANYGKLNGTVDPSLMPAYRGFLCAFLYGANPTIGDANNPLIRHWLLGTQPSVPQYSFEVGSLPDDANRLMAQHYLSVLEDGDQGDANPVAVLYDILTGTNGKLGIPKSRIDAVSFGDAAAIMYGNQHGFSRSWEGGTSAKDMIDEILRQIDAVLYEDPTDGLIKIRIIRADYDTTSILQINPDNCEKIDNFSMSGQTGAPNKVRVVYSNRQDSYLDGSGIAHNEANAIGQSGEVRELVLQMPGICTQKLADSVAARELDARCRPVMKFTATVDRSFYKTVLGDVVKVLWPKRSLSNVVMRVAAVNRGTQEQGKIRLDLIQDYFHIWRNRPPVTPGGVPLKTPGSSSLP